jgi:NAD+ synthase (glutamine-hydrolysing)
MVSDNDGNVIARALAFREDLLVIDIPKDRLTKEQPQKVINATAKKSSIITVADKVIQTTKPDITWHQGETPAPVEEVYEALVLGLRDYVLKNGFGNVTIGLSGGIDSAIVAALAVDALGKDRVVGVFMPSRYTSKESEEDARELAKNLGISMLEVPIDGIYKAYIATFEPLFKGRKEDITEENIQARIRGNILMALSNKLGWLVLTTGNKSEMSVGYATLYGDMAGGFAVIMGLLYHSGFSKRNRLPNLSLTRKIGILSLLMTRWTKSSRPMLRRISIPRRSFLPPWKGMSSTGYRKWWMEASTRGGNLLPGSRLHLRRLARTGECP